jgi:phage terminase large subunit-like protein
MNLAELMGATPDQISAGLDRLKDNPAQLARVYDLAQEIDKRLSQTRGEHLFPDETHDWRGETFHAREGYEKHLEFFDATREYMEVCMRAANRIGKTVAGCYCGGVWATGRYPKWWTGHVFNKPVSMWVAGKRYESTRDILQTGLFGKVIGGGPGKSFSGDGVIPGDRIGKPTWRQGVQNLADTVPVRHESGRWSEIGLKAYEQGRGAFEGTAKDAILFDEEPPTDIYGEALIRLMTTNGRMLLTYTPLEGMSGTTLLFEEE